MLFSLAAGESVLFSLSLSFSLSSWMIPGVSSRRRAARPLCLAHVEGRNRSERRVWRRGKKKSTHPTPTTTVDDIQLLYSLCVCVYYMLFAWGGGLYYSSFFSLFSVFLFYSRRERGRDTGNLLPL